MRAMVCMELGPPERLRLEQRPTPEPGPGEVRVRVRAAGVSFVDALTVQGLYQSRAQPPFVPGNEIAGEVEALGPGVEGFARGDRVLSMPPLGGFAEALIAKPHQLWRRPAWTSSEPPVSEAATARRTTRSPAGASSGRERRCWCSARAGAWASPPSIWGGRSARG